MSKVSPVKKLINTVSISFAAIVLACPSMVAKTYDTGTETGAEFVPAKPIASPCPCIPSDMKEECMHSCCTARFQIAQDGKAKVKLLSGSGSDEIDDITLQTLSKWKFKPAMLDGKPVPSTRRIKVEFQVD